SASCPPFPGRLKDYFFGGWLVDWSEPVSTGFWVSVGCPVTSPGFDMPVPVVLPVSGVVALGAAGRWTLPRVEGSDEAGGPAVPLSSPFAVLLLEGAAGLLWPLSLLVVCARAPNAESASANAAIAMIFTRSPPLEETVETQRCDSNDRAVAKPRSSSRNHT